MGSIGLRLLFSVLTNTLLVLHPDEAIEGSLELVDVDIAPITATYHSPLQLLKPSLAEIEVLFQIADDVRQSEFELEEIGLSYLIFPQIIDYFVHVRIQVPQLGHRSIQLY